MKNTFIVYGPQGCGKTRNALVLAQHFGCDWIEDSWEPGIPLRPGALHLCSLDLSEERNGSAVPAYPFDEIMERIKAVAMAKAGAKKIDLTKLEAIGPISLSDWRLTGADYTKINGGSIDGKPTNPKDAVGIRKWRQYTTVPATVIAEVGVAMMEGALKYGRHNYRVAGVRASVYVDAAKGHIDQYWEGEDFDPDVPGQRLSHITKAIASLVVLRDAEIQNMLTDDRPPKANLDKVRGDMQAVVEALLDKYPEGKAAFTEIGEQKKRAADQDAVLAALCSEAGKPSLVVDGSISSVDLQP